MSEAVMDMRREIASAETRIRPYVRETPVEESPALGGLGRGRVVLKLEHLQITGSFKLRGAMNKLLSLPREQREKGVVTASSGNHGAAGGPRGGGPGPQGGHFFAGKRRPPQRGASHR